MKIQLSEKICKKSLITDLGAVGTGRNFRGFCEDEVEVDEDDQEREEENSHLNGEVRERDRASSLRETESEDGEIREMQHLLESFCSVLAEH